MMRLRPVWCAVSVLCSAFMANARTTVDQDAATAQRGEPVAHVDSQPVYADELRYWLRFVESYYKTETGVAEISDWSVQQNGVPLREFMVQSALDYACRDRAIEMQAAALGVSVSAAQQAELDEARASAQRAYGSQSDYQRIVARTYQSEAVYEYLAYIEVLGNNLFAHLYGANGERCDDDCVNQYVQQHQFMALKYVFLGASDAAGKPLSVTQRRAQLQRLQRWRAQLLRSQTLQSDFDQLMTAFNQDEAVMHYPAGRLMSAASKPAAVVQAYLATPPGQLSEVVSVAEGDYLMLRMPLYPAMPADAAGRSLRYWAAYQQLYRQQVAEWCAQLPVERTSALTQLLP